MQNLWPGLKRAFNGIKEIVVNLAHAFEKAWPSISAALTTAWQIIHPILDLLATLMGKVQDVLAWLSANAAPAISALAGAINTVLSGAQAVIEGVAGAFEAVYGVMKDIIGLAGGGTGKLQQQPGGRPIGGRGGVPGTNAGGTGNWRGGLTWVGEQGKELVNLPRGSQVIPHGPSMQMAGGGGITLYGTFDLGAGVKQRLRMEFDKTGRQLRAASKWGDS
jgi:phage-related protein